MATSAKYRSPVRTTFTSGIRPATARSTTRTASSVSRFAVRSVDP
ncbi:MULTISPECIES: hypothetical protein [unclassified Streptomyces]|nr:hypothetical protein [Streptomyces sp. CB02058]